MKKVKAGYKMFMTYITPEQHDQGQLLAAKQGRSFCSIVRELLKKAIALDKRKG